MVRISLRLVVVALGALALALVPAGAQPRSFLLPWGAELERLERLVGTWEGRLRRVMPGGGEIELAPVLEFGWDVGGVWLRGVDVTTLPNGDVIENNTWLTWHAREQRYHGAWQDNVFPAFVPFTAEWEGEDALVIDSGTTEINGRAHRIVTRYEFVGDDEHRTTMRQSWDGEPLEVVATGRWTRVGDDEADAE